MRDGIPMLPLPLLLALLPGCSVFGGTRPTPPPYDSSGTGDYREEPQEEAPVEPWVPPRDMWGLHKQDLFTFAGGNWHARMESSGEPSPAKGRTGLWAGRFEWTRVTPEPEEDRAKVTSLLLEYVEGTGSAEDSVVFDDEAYPRRTTAFSRQAWVLVAMGHIREPRAGPSGELEGFGYRGELLLGARLSSIEVREADGSGYGKERDLFNSPEFCIGGRFEGALHERVRLFARADAGILPLLLYNSGTVHLLGGIRLEPVRHVGIEVGWRYLASSANRLSFLSADSARVLWTGPWLGVEIRF